MGQTTAEFLLQRLHENGVRRIYGYPGDGINAIVGALEGFSDRIEFVQARHEEMAAFMACAHAKWTGEVGVCLATSGPGAIHLLNGLYDAKLDHQPVLAIVGQQARAALGGSYQQEVDLQTLFKDVAHEYCEHGDRRGADPPPRRPRAPDRARPAHSRRASSSRTTSARSPPFAEPPREHGTIHSSPGWSAPRIVPQEPDLAPGGGDPRRGREGRDPRRPRRARRARAGDADRGEARRRRREGAARRAPPSTTRCPTSPASIGLLGTKPSWTLMSECDTLLMVGSSFPYSEFLPEPGKARGVQIDIDGRMLNLRYPMELGLDRRREGDARGADPARSTTRQIADGARRSSTTLRDWWRLIEDRALQDADPINPQRVFWELNRHLPDDAIISADSGTSATGSRATLKLKPSHMASLSGNARHDGARRALRDRREVRAPESARARARRRRRDADERDGRADHRREVLRPLGGPAADRARAQQPRPESGDLGAARDGGRPEERRRRRRSPTFATPTSRA